MMKALTILFFTLIFISCGDSKNDSGRSRLVPEPDKALREKYEKTRDSLKNLKIKTINDSSVKNI